MTKPQAYSLTGKRLHVQPTDTIRFSEGLALQTFLVFSGSSAQTVEIPIKFTPYSTRGFRPRLQRFYL